jgi:hypothetical protein
MNWVQLLSCIFIAVRNASLFFRYWHYSYVMPRMYCKLGFVIFAKLSYTHSHLSVSWMNCECSLQPRPQVNTFLPGATHGNLLARSVNASFMRAAGYMRKWRRTVSPCSVVYTNFITDPPAEKKYNQHPVKQIIGLDVLHTVACQNYMPNGDCSSQKSSK